MVFKTILVFFKKKKGKEKDVPLQVQQKYGNASFLHHMIARNLEIKRERNYVLNQFRNVDF